ncbi:MAG: hypothetical protein RR215_07140, partial [Ruthenibacterium sp.]
SGLYIIQRYDLYNKNQIIVGENGATYTTAEEMAALLREECALSSAQRVTRRAMVTACATRYGCKEFVAAVMNVYQRAQREYKAK